jgi:ATP-dependent DNA ligase
MNGVPASLPFIDPCVPREVRQPPKGQEWIHQPKLDGWRCQAVKVGPKVILYSRHGHDLSRRFPTSLPLLPSCRQTSSL